MSQKVAVVFGGGGFIGNAMVSRLVAEGYWVRAVDLKYPEHCQSEAHDFIKDDLRSWYKVDLSTRVFNQSGRVDELYQFAADMGGAGYIFTGEHDADLMTNSAMINLNVCLYATKYKVGKLFYSSSACMYPKEIQDSTYNMGLRELDAYPANPDSEYGWEKLFSERLYLAYARNYGLNVRIARFHNIYGPEGTYQGGREKAPAAMCRKVITRDGDWVEVWGTGQQTRSFLFIDDCIDAVRLLMESDHKEPINIGSEEMISINGLAKLAISFSGHDIEIKNIDSNAIGVMGRNSDNTLIEKVLNWKPKYTLKEGLEKTFFWIKSQYEK